MSDYADTLAVAEAIAACVEDGDSYLIVPRSIYGDRYCAVWQGEAEDPVRCWYIRRGSSELTWTTDIRERDGVFSARVWTDHGWIRTTRPVETTR